MSHLRKEIRKAAVDLLKNAGTLAGNNVFPTRVREVWQKEMPCILVYTEDEAASSPIEPAYITEREVKLLFEVRAAGDDNMDDLSDDLSNQIEDAIKADPRFGGNADRSEYKGAVPQILMEGDTLFAATVLTYKVIYLSDLP